MFQRKKRMFQSVSLAFALCLMILFSVPCPLCAEEKADDIYELPLYKLRKRGWVSLTWKAAETRLQRIGNR